MKSLGKPNLDAACVTLGYHTGKLSLHGGREIRVFDIAINGRLCSKHGIKVGDVLICRFCHVLTWLMEGCLPQD